jgi:hypothetical protein
LKSVSDWQASASGLVHTFTPDVAVVVVVVVAGVTVLVV